MNTDTHKTLLAVANDSSGSLGKILQKTKQLNLLNQLWQIETEPDLARHTCIANFRKDILVIEVESSAWATRLRYAIPELIKKLKVHPEFSTLQNIVWYIQPIRSTPTKTAIKKPILLSSQDAQLLQDAANCTENEKLKIALQNLAKNFN